MILYRHGNIPINNIYDRYCIKTGRGGKDAVAVAARAHVRPTKLNGPRRRRRRRFNFLCSHHLDITARVTYIQHTNAHTRDRSSPPNGRFLAHNFRRIHHSHTIRYKIVRFSPIVSRFPPPRIFQYRRTLVATEIR